ncbi:hypothetical protein O2V63_15020 [Modestobacter sp. VKM Ac-2977]|uniref:hypothetical protein n=1 Tax=Modestobacter sp. VKM Ac-2977 TaxID=3004131 RepID=UPI0022AAB998|nr:hypothetical protein [Modestobacter sp. VKM Ac-2977]MCZ2821655.1 hypothetical protein [Modestobacter sp. VKM Ac-2977]
MTYTVDVVDEEALLRAGAATWDASAGGWALRTDDDGGVAEATTEEVAAVTPGLEASIAFVLGAQPYPVVPGVWFAASSVDVEPGNPPGPAHAAGPTSS